MIDIHFYCQGYGNYKGLAIIQDFTAHWTIKKEQMFGHLIQLECEMFSYMIKALNQILKRSPYAYFLSLSEL